VRRTSWRAVGGEVQTLGDEGAGREGGRFQLILPRDPVSANKKTSDRPRGGVARWVGHLCSSRVQKCGTEREV